MTSGPIASAHQRSVRSQPIAWLAISLFLLAVTLNRHDSIRSEIGKTCGGLSASQPAATEADVREMQSHD